MSVQTVTSVAGTSLPNHEPLLLPNLRRALCHLYSLNSTQSPSNFQADANFYLMEFQSRNIRRQIRSLHQRERDSSDQDVTLDKKSETLSNDISRLDRGSSFYASLPLLLCSRSLSHEAERIFCSQTILHRLRRMKVSEAIDWEIEFHNMGRISSHPSSLPPHTFSDKSPKYWAEFVKFHGENLSSFHITFLGQVLNSYYQETWCCNNNSLPPSYESGMGLEERVKGEMCLLILASAAYFTVFSHIVETELRNRTAGNISHPTTSQYADVGSTLHNLSSAMALIAVRIRYTPASTSPAISTPIVSLLVKALEHVGNIASSLSLEQIISQTNENPSQQQSFHQMLSNEKDRIHKLAFNQCICDGLASVTDALLGSPGGARGRLSIELRCLQAAGLELRNPETGIQLLKDALLCVLGSCNNESDESLDKLLLQRQVLRVCERWAKFLPLPMNFVEETMPLVVHVLGNFPSSPVTNELSPIATIAFNYLIRIYEGACMTIDEIIAASVGLSRSNPKQQQGHKRSNKSKKRHKERLQAAVNHGDTVSVEQAERELHHRGEVACRTAALSWEIVQPFMTKSLEFAQSISSEIVLLEGEGPIGCMCVCASACLPHLIKYHSQTSSFFGESTSVFFDRIIEALKLVCCHSNGSIRALSFEHVVKIHSTLLESTRNYNVALSELESSAMRGILDCVLGLASMCAYPPMYFSDLTLDNDENLEIERNDVRDVLRSITSFGNSDRQSMPLLVFMSLDFILQDCADRIESGGNALPHETILHTLSSLAKPLNCLGRTMASKNDSAEQSTNKMLFKAIVCLRVICSRLLDAFSCQISMCDIIPIGRLACIAIASFSPLLSSIAKKMKNIQFVSEHMKLEFEKALGLFFLTAITCVANIPELIAESTLETSKYDIRGAMRGPGGEDHVGVIALKRCVEESDVLALAVLKNASLAKGVTITSIIEDLSSVHEMLYNVELERGPSVLYGKGVAPRSRRVLLASLSRLAIISINNFTECTEPITNKLHQLLQRPLAAIRLASERTDISHAEKIFQLCEASFDLSSFPSSVISSLLSDTVQNQDHAAATKEIKGLINTCVSAYAFISNNDCEPSTATIQWGRLRGSISYLLYVSANPDFSPLTASSITALNRAECEAIAVQCSAGPQSHSSIFNDSVICDEVVAAGIFIIVIRDALENIHKALRKENSPKEQVDCNISGCVSTLIGSKDSVFSVLSSDNPEPHHGFYTDPRPTVSEAWFLAMISLLSIYDRAQWSILNNQFAKKLTYETLALCVHLLLLKPLERKESNNNQNDAFGMSLDGPQSLAMIEFIHMALATGPDIFNSIAEQYESRLQIDFGNLTQSLQCNPGYMGGSIICAALFRGSSGALPPWVIESVPKLYATLFATCGSGENFCSIIMGGANLKLKHEFASIRGGRKLAGYFFDTMSANEMQKFLSKTKDICLQEDNKKWRNFKVLLKGVCGGKKKATSFNLKPQPTDWECIRI